MPRTGTFTTSPVDETPAPALPTPLTPPPPQQGVNEVLILLPDDHQFLDGVTRWVLTHDFRFQEALLPATMIDLMVDNATTTQTTAITYDNPDGTKYQALNEKVLFGQGNAAWKVLDYRTIRRYGLEEGANATSLPNCVYLASDKEGDARLFTDAQVDGHYAAALDDGKGGKLSVPKAIAKGTLIRLQIINVNNARVLYVSERTAKHPEGAILGCSSLQLFGSKDCQALMGSRICAADGALAARNAAEELYVKRAAGDDGSYVEAPDPTPLEGFKTKSRDAAALAIIHRALVAPSVGQREAGTREWSVTAALISTANMCPTSPVGKKHADPFWGEQKARGLEAQALIVALELPQAGEIAEMKATLGPTSDEVRTIQFVEWARTVEDGVAFIQGSLLHERSPTIAALFDEAKANVDKLIETELVAAVPKYCAIMKKHVDKGLLKGGLRMWAEQIVLTYGTATEKAEAARGGRQQWLVVAGRCQGEKIQFSWKRLKYVEDGTTWAEVVEGLES